jgi:hypothetical protein
MGEARVGDCHAGTHDVTPTGKKMTRGTQEQKNRRDVWDCGVACWHAPKVLACALMLASLTTARADEGGTSFWLPGQYASFAALAPPPGWSIATELYYYSGSAPDSASQGSAVPPGTRSQSTQLSLAPTYSPGTTVLRGQLALFLSFGVGTNTTQAGQSGSASPSSQTVSGFTDVSPGATLSWSRGSDYWMAYLTGNIPVGSYESQRLANIGIGHAAIDAGGAYTFASSRSGLSLSVGGGFTYNFENWSTDYQNGIDSHMGWSAMQSLSPTWRAGLAGYVYYQLTGDSGSGNTCGPCKSRVASVGPQVNYTFTIAGQEWSANLRGYYEFWAQNRLEGYTVFLTLSIPLGGAK